MNVWTADNMGWTPLHVAAGTHQDDSVVTMLIAMGADKTLVDTNGDTPLKALLDAETSSKDFYRTMGMTYSRRPEFNACLALLS